MYYLRNFDKQADAVGQKAYLPTIAIVGGVNKVGYFDGDASKDSVFSEDGNFINVGEKETRVVCTYNVTSTGSTQICDNTTGFTSMEVDGTKVTLATGYTFTTTGEHTVKFTFKDNTTISDFAFYDCSSLTSATIPSCVINIGDRAFYNTPWYKSYSADTANQYGNIIYINNVAYQATSTGITSCEFKEGTVGIGNKAFVYCTGLTSVVIPDSVTSIGDSAFDSCTSLTSVTIPDSVTKIGYSAFGGCEGLTSVTIPDSVTSIGDAAFSNCFRLTSITIPDSVTSIGSDTFFDCSKLTSVTIGNSVTSIGNDAFESCTGLSSIKIPDSVTTIGEEAFLYCYGLTSVTIGSGVTSIGQQAFSDCTSLKSITYKSTVAQWKAITRGTNWHKNVTAANVTCSDGSCGLDDTTA